MQAVALNSLEARSLLEESEQMLNAFLFPEQDPGQMRKREQILQSATALFVAHGYRKTSMEEVAVAAGVAKGTVYLYFRNKAELLFHAVAFQNQQYMGELSAALDPELNPRDQLRNIIVLSITLSRRAPLIARMTGGDREINLALRDIDTGTLADIGEKKIGFITRLIAAAADGRLARQAASKRAMVLLDLMYAVNISGRWPTSALSLEEYAGEVADLLVSGLLS